MVPTGFEPTTLESKYEKLTTWLHRSMFPVLTEKVPLVNWFKKILTVH